MPKLPLETVRRRVRRATELGLAYPEYASILLGTGRDIIGFLYTCQGLGLRLQRTPAIPPNVSAKLSALKGCSRIVLTNGPHAPVKTALVRTQTPVEQLADAPLPKASWAESRSAIRAALGPLKLPSDAVVLIGTDVPEQTWAKAAGLARFLPAERYFSK